MKRFNEWLKNLNESITFKIADLSEDQEDVNFPDLTVKLAKKTKEMFPDLFSDTGKSFYDIVTYDGNYFTNGTEEINFYAGFFPESQRKKVLDAILYLLREFNMKQSGPVRSDFSRMHENIITYRIPVISQNNTNPAPEINIASANAAELLKLLGIDSRYGYGSISVADLNIKLNQLTDMDFEKQMALRAVDKGRNFISFGLTESQLERYLKVLKSMVDWALKNNYDTIHYG